MEMELSYKEMRDILIDIEKKYSVYDLEYKDIYYWKLIRMNLYGMITRKLGFVKQGHPLTKVDNMKRFKNILKYGTKNFLKRRRIRKYDTLVFTHGRKNKINEDYEDIYVYDIIKDLEKNNTEHLIIDKADHYGEHLGKEKDNLIYSEGFKQIIRKISYPFAIKKIGLKENRDIISTIKKEIEERLNVRIDLEELIKKEIFIFEFHKKYYDKLLDKVQPIIIYLVVSYGREQLIASARERNIKVIELQHGVISNYHMGYYFPFDFPIPYFPDELILFGKYWKESVDYPINSKKYVRHFSLVNNKNQDELMNQKTQAVLFVSQGSIGTKLSVEASRFANQNNIPCYYKLHPSEFSKWEDRYPELLESVKKNKITVIKDEKSIYELSSICNYVIGVNSTVIYESLMYECKTFVMKYEGYQHMDYLIQNNYVGLLSGGFSFNQLKAASNKKIEDKLYFYS